jgi:integrase
MSDELAAEVLSVPSHKEPGAAETARARHRRSHLPCTPDLLKDLLAIVEQYVGASEMRDTRHYQAAAWPMLDQWLRDLELEGKRPRTVDTYERQVAPLLRTNPETTFGAFTSEQVKRALGAVPQRSRYISRSILNCWFEWGEWCDYIEPNQNPMRKVPKMVAGERRPTTLFSEAEVAQLISLPVPDGPLFALLFGALLRRQDAITLKRRHVDLERLRVHIFDGKGGKDAVIPITPATAAAVADLDLLERLDPDDYLWARRVHNTSRRSPISSTEFARWYSRSIEQAGVRYLKPHTTRHTGHWILKYAEKLDLEERQIVLRHASPETTVRQYPVTDVEDVALKRAAIA